MNKTEMMLLMQTGGRPTLKLSECADLLNMEPRSLLNRIYAHKTPFPMFQLEGSTEWIAHVSDVAAHIEAQRNAAAKDLEGDDETPAKPSTRAPAARGRRARKTAAAD